MDSRPSDAVPLALSLQRPIFVSAKVMEEVGQELPEPFDEEAWLAEIMRERASSTQRRKFGLTRCLAASGLRSGPLHSINMPGQRPKSATTTTSAPSIFCWR
ncbi:MAG: DUF151 domain-containing protein [Caldilineaceae bacterium]